MGGARQIIEAGYSTHSKKSQSLLHWHLSSEEPIKEALVLLDNIQGHALHQLLVRADWSSEQQCGTFIDLHPELIGLALHVCRKRNTLVQPVSIRFAYTSYNNIPTP